MKRLSLLHRVIGLVLILLIPLNILLILSFRVLTNSSVEALLNTLEFAGASAAAAVETRIARTIELGEAAARLAAILSDDFEQIREEAVRVLPNTSDSWIFLSDPQGQTLFSQIAAPGEPLTRRQAEGLESTERAFRTRRPVVSGARFVSQRGDWFAAVDVPVFRDGAPFRILSVSIRCTSLSKILSSQPLPEGWLTGILDEHGRFVARSRDGGLIGKPASKSWREYKDKRGLALLQTADGDSVYTANFPATVAPGWAIGVGVEEKQLHEAARRTAQWVIPASVAISLLSATLAILLARSIARPLREIGERLPLLLDQTDRVPHSLIPEIKAVEDAIRHAGAARSEALERLSDSERQLRLVLDNTLAFVGILSADGRLLYVNRPALAASGIAADEVIGKYFWDCFWWEYDDDQSRQIEEAVRRAAKGEVVRYDAVARIAPDGRLPIDFMLSAVRDADGTVTLLVPSGFDISDRKQNEEKLRLLMREVNHRSKNLLAVVQAIAGQTFPRNAGDALGAFQNRLMGLSASQDLLVNNEWAGVDLAELARKQLEHLTPSPTSIRLDGPPLMLKPAAAQAIGMAFHELATNATKYGAFSITGGCVTISWQLEANMFRITWAETGGPKVRPPASFGFGMRVLRDLAMASLNGEVQMSFEPDGVVWYLEARAQEIRAWNGD